MTELPAYIEDTKYYAFDESGKALISFDKASEIPEDLFDDMLAQKKSDAVGRLQKMGCIGKSIHSSKAPIDLLTLAVIRKAIDDHGEDFPVLYRGSRSKRPLTEYAVIYATHSKDVAEFYGEVTTLKNVRGLRTRSMAKSVVTDDYSEIDDEVILLPEDFLK